MATMYIYKALRALSTGRTLLLSAGLAVTFGSAGAQTTLNFNNQPNPNNGSGYNGQSILNDQGFSLTDTGPILGNLHSVSPDGGALGYNYTGSVALFNGSTDGAETLTQDNGDPFGIQSIDIANLLLQSNTPGGVTVLFTGNVQGGGTVTKSFTHGNDDGLTTVTFDSSFANLTSFTINQTAPYNQFDNIVLSGPASSTPEPGTFALCGAMSVLGVGCLRRRRRK